jgi:sulfoxide reductase heme-binding subunit YedZ
VVLVLFMGLPLFDASVYPHGDLFSGAFPQQRAGNHTGPMGHGHGTGHTGPMRHGGSHTSSLTPSRDQIRHRSFARQFTLATGYVALGLLTLTLLIGPANLLLRRRNPVSSHLRRDVGAWTAIGSVVHVIFGLQVHGGGQISDFLDYFVAPNGSPRLNSFGLGNWTGLAALVIVGGLLALSSDLALRKLKARPWKRLQRLNYALFALVILHAFFYGALLRVTSPFTLLLGLSIIAVFVGQAVGVWLWRRRYSRAGAKLA